MEEERGRESVITKDIIKLDNETEEKGKCMKVRTRERLKLRKREDGR